MTLWHVLFAFIGGGALGIFFGAACCAAGRADRAAADYEPYDPEAR